MQETGGSIVENYGNFTTENMLFTYSEEEEEKQNNEINRVNASLVLKPEFIPMYPSLLGTLSILESCLYGFIKFFLSNNEKCYITNEQFAELFKVSEKTISGAVKNLEKLGYIHLTKKIRGGGGLIRFIRLSNEYKNIKKQQVQPYKCKKVTLGNVKTPLCKIQKGNGIYNNIIDNNIIENKYIENSNEFSDLKDLDVDSSTPTCTYQAGSVSCDSNSHLNQSICVQEKEKSCAKKEKEVAVAGFGAQKCSESKLISENKLISEVISYYNSNGLLYDDKYEHKYAKLILNNKQVNSICECLDINVLEFCKMIIKASFNSYKGVVSGFKSLYERYAEIYNNTIKGEFNKVQKVQTGTFKSAF